MVSAHLGLPGCEGCPAASCWSASSKVPPTIFPPPGSQPKAAYWISGLKLLGVAPEVTGEFTWPDQGWITPPPTRATAAIAATGAADIPARRQRSLRRPP